MISSRLELHEFLTDILGNGNVYFQPPESVKMKYPAIVYSRSGISNVHADDSVYVQTCEYDVTVIDIDPESPAAGRLSKTPYCRYSRHYTANNLNHDVFTIIIQGGI